MVANGTGEITQSGTLDVTGITTLSASGSDITLDNNTNDFQAAVRSTAINVDLQDKSCPLSMYLSQHKQHNGYHLPITELTACQCSQLLLLQEFSYAVFI